MKKKRAPFEIRDRKAKGGSGPNAAADSIPQPSESQKWNREVVESLIVAVILALMIRSFEAEAFVIPTGSMAPTLQGRHKDVACSKCGFAYQAGASEDAEVRNGSVATTVCPMCKFPMELHANGLDPHHVSFTGDRILVNKFAFDVMGRPNRWDVIVFKYPGNSKQNYIKRLIGLPGETVRLSHGDVFVKPRDANDEQFAIARKPPPKLRALLQLVHDTAYIPADFEAAGLPPAWSASDGGSTFTTADYGRTFALDTSDSPQWIRYRNILPELSDWVSMLDGNPLPSIANSNGTLITDFYAYNATFHGGNAQQDSRRLQRQLDNLAASFEAHYDGSNWVGDLAVEADVVVKSDAGTLLLDLVEGGWHFGCQIDVATGEAKLTINGGNQPWGENEPSEAAAAAESSPRRGGTAVATGKTKLAGRGTYRLLLANADNEVRLWVNDRLVEFDQATTYSRTADIRPAWSESDPGDLAPAGIGGQNLAMQIGRLRILRDIYYTAVKRGDPAAGYDPQLADFNNRSRFTQVLTGETQDELSNPQLLYRNPRRWSMSPAFNLMSAVDFELQDFPDDRLDQFLPMGDNSPQSQDGRIWDTDLYVERQMLIGEAVYIYFPHPWHIKLPFLRSTLPVVPNFGRMGIIH